MTAPALLPIRGEVAGVPVWPSRRLLATPEAAYLLRSNLAGESEAELWRMHMQLNDAGAAFRTLKQDPSIRPIYQHLGRRVGARVGLLSRLRHVPHLPPARVRPRPADERPQDPQRP